MQPYFFPYLGYFALLANTDRWVVFDVTQYTPKSWMNRNRVLHPTGGWSYVTVPLRGSSQNMKIREARILDPIAAHRSVRGKLSHYRRSAPHYAEVCNLVDQVFDGLVDDSLTHLNVIGLNTVCTYLQIPFTYEIASEMDMQLPAVSHPGGWAPAIAGALGADEYINPPGGRALFKPDEFAAHGVTLGYIEMPSFVYATADFGFEPDLSILDVLMWNDPGTVIEAIETARILQES
jgi:hypothetical protein